MRSERRSTIFLAAVLGLLLASVVSAKDAPIRVSDIPKPQGFGPNYYAMDHFSGWLGHSLKVRVVKGATHYGVLEFKPRKACAGDVQGFLQLWTEAKIVEETMYQTLLPTLGGGKAQWFNYKFGERLTKGPKGLEFKDTEERVEETPENYRKFVDQVCGFTDRAAVADELAVGDFADMVHGDLFVKKGKRGGAVMVLHGAMDEETEETVYLLAAARDDGTLVILKNKKDKLRSPWFKIRKKGFKAGGVKYTPKDLRRLGRHKEIILSD